MDTAHCSLFFLLAFCFSVFPGRSVAVGGDGHDREWSILWVVCIMVNTRNVRVGGGMIFSYFFLPFWEEEKQKKKERKFTSAQRRGTGEFGCPVFGDIPHGLCPRQPALLQSAYPSPSTPVRLPQSAYPSPSLGGIAGLTSMASVRSAARSPRAMRSRMFCMMAVRGRPATNTLLSISPLSLVWMAWHPDLHVFQSCFPASQPLSCWLGSRTCVPGNVCS